MTLVWLGVTEITQIIELIWEEYSRNSEWGYILSDYAARQLFAT